MSASVITSAPMRESALKLAAGGWQVLPCYHRDLTAKRRAKAPAGWLVPRGVLDATTDAASVASWWSRYSDALIGARVPDWLFVLDVDPRHGGDAFMAALESEHGALPATLTTRSGGPDGSYHLWWRHPGVKLSDRTFRRSGVDLRTSANYVIVPPSPHPATGRAYRWESRPVADPPAWLLAQLTPAAASAPAPTSSPRSLSRRLSGPSVADLFCEHTTWADVLLPHGWRCLDPDGDADGARWLHPSATSGCSATVRHGVLFVYSTNTPFEVTEPGAPHGVTRFRAWAVLDHSGDLSAAARELLGVAS